MHTFSFNRKLCLTGVKILILNLALSVPVQCVGNIRIKSIKIKVCRSRSTLLIRSKSNADLAVWNLLFYHCLKHLHNLRNSRLIINPKNCAPI